MKKITFLFFGFLSSILYSQSISWDNSPGWGATTNIGSTLSMQITYDAGVGNDINYMHIVLSRINSGYGVLEDYGSGGVFPVTEDDLDSNTINYDFEIPSAPLTASLTNGEQIMLRVYIEYDLSGGGVGYQNANIVMNLEETLSIQDVNFKKDFKFYPNPVKNKVLIKNYSDYDSYEIRTITGQLIKEGQVQKIISMTGLNPGLYILRLDNNNYKRFIKL